MSFSLAIPHTPWVPERVESMRRICDALDLTGLTFRIFCERAPNWEWSLKMWTWGAMQEASHFLQLQDDVVIGERFWPQLTAMVAAVPNKIIGLQGAHPSLRLLARDGHRWARSNAWMVGVGYVIPRWLLRDLVDYRASLPDVIYASTNEDDLIAQFCIENGHEVWHPIPTIIDHDTTVASTYMNDSHLWRRPIVTWREYGAELEDPGWWAAGVNVPLIANPHMSACWLCQNEPSCITHESTGAKIGRICLARCVGKVLTQGIGASSQRGGEDE